MNQRFSRNPVTILKIILILAVLAFALVTLNGCCPEKGDTGAIGEKGVQGTPAIAPNVTTSPATSEQCLNGGAVVMINGIDTVICNGSNGSAGHNGTDASPVTPVSFCGAPSIYPSAFPEYGLLIGNRMFGVYSLNGGFLALLPPGLYNSNAVGSSCNFLINADGTVTRQ